MDRTIAYKHEIGPLGVAWHAAKPTDDFHQSGVFDPNGSLYVVQGSGAVWHVRTFLRCLVSFGYCYLINN